MRQRIDFPALARLVLQRGYTTKRLGDEIGMSQPSISRLARARGVSINADAGVQLIRLAGGVVTLPEVMADSEPAPHPGTVAAAPASEARAA